MKYLLPGLLTALLLSFAPAHVQAQEPDTSESAPIPDETVMKSGAQILGARNINAFSRRNRYGGLVGKTSVGGYFDTEYFFPQDKPAFFDQHRLILQVSSMPHERILFNAEIEFEHGGLLGGGTKDGELKIEQAWLDYKIEDWLVFRSGVILVPLGRLNVLHDSDYRDTTARPLFSSSVVPSTWMEPGAGFYGTMYPDDNWEINYELYVMQGLTDQISGSGLKSARPSLSADFNQAKAVTARVGLSPFIGLDMGLGGYFTRYDKDSLKNLGLVVGDFNWTSGPFELVGEGGVALFDPVAQKDSNGKALPDLNGPMWGYYVEAHYHLFPEFLKLSFLGEEFERPVITLFARLDQVDTNGPELNANDRIQFSLGLNYRPIETTVFKLEYQWNLETAALVTGNSALNKDNNQLLASVAMGF